MRFIRWFIEYKRNALAGNESPLRWPFDQFEMSKNVFIIQANRNATTNEQKEEDDTTNSAFITRQQMRSRNEREDEHFCMYLLLVCSKKHWRVGKCSSRNRFEYCEHSVCGGIIL